MRLIELDHGKLLGYTIVGSDEKHIAKRGSAKIGDKWVTEMAGELSPPAERADSAE